MYFAVERTFYNDIKCTSSIYAVNETTNEASVPDEITVNHFVFTFPSFDSVSLWHFYDIFLMNFALLFLAATFFIWIEIYVICHIDMKTIIVERHSALNAKRLICIVRWFLERFKAGVHVEVLKF